MQGENLLLFSYLVFTPLYCLIALDFEDFLVAIVKFVFAMKELRVEGGPKFMPVHARGVVCARACVRVCVCSRVCLPVRLCVRTYACMCMYLHFLGIPTNVNGVRGILVMLGGGGSFLS